MIKGKSCLDCIKTDVCRYKETYGKVGEQIRKIVSGKSSNKSDIKLENDKEFGLNIECDKFLKKNNEYSYEED